MALNLLYQKCIHGRINLQDYHFLLSSISNNNNFNLYNFINNNYQSLDKIKNNIIDKNKDYIISYNVHSFQHLNIDFLYVNFLLLH
jgi:hypothetical protein